MVNLWDASDSEDSEAPCPAARQTHKRKELESDISDDVEILPDAKRKALMSKATLQAELRLASAAMDGIPEHEDSDADSEVQMVSRSERRPEDDEDADIDALLKASAADGRQQHLDPKLSAGFDRHRLLLQQLNAAEVEQYASSEDEREPTPPLRPSLRHNARPQPSNAKGVYPADHEEDESLEEAIANGSSEQKVILVLQTKSGSRQTVRLPVDAPFGRLFDKYGQLEKSLPKGEAARFLLDGEAILPVQTPEDLDIEDDTVIDVHW